MRGVIWGFEQYRNARVPARASAPFHFGRVGLQMNHMKITMSATIAATVSGMCQRIALLVALVLPARSTARTLSGRRSRS